MEYLLFAPPIVFLFYLVLFMGGSKWASKYTLVGKNSDRQLEGYACGQRDVQHYVNPDYSEFFPIAFFFTIMHVLVLVVATAPYKVSLLPILFILAGILSMVILFKR